MGVSKERVTEIAKAAKKAFTKHKIRPVINNEIVGLWRCGAPGESAYHFSVTVIEASILLTGDLDVLVVQRQEDMIGWARGSIESVDYFASKVPHSIPTKEFSMECVAEWLEGERANAEEPNEELQEAWRRVDECVEYGLSESEVVSLVADERTLSDGDFPNFQTWKRQFLWQREALKWWLANLSPGIK